ncbi:MULTISPECIES: DedA family protein [Paraburkholderia]|uniref:DedA family protein n=1 Tax=Paraburkholderia TaxID=1822464 RepID=UPI002251C4CB|nr:MULTISPECIES: DedA family protein [Paraburkholderia]MCX4155042.1 DedA family protein [Paraburkholderia aspalathi]MDN7164452.1 DedA family protein [Paraburkholderia sp. SECH2]MDQ6392937.1 DedA family protein [Paraburkholderia aspalathi]
MFSHELLSRYGALIVFFSVLFSSLGLPFPSITTLITIGASITITRYDFARTLFHCAILVAAAVSGGLLGDLLWFQGGKRYGRRTLQLVSRLSFTRQSYVTGFEYFFYRRGARTLLIARFVPGLSLIAVPLCGAMAIKTRSFILHDCVSVSTWACAGLLAGALFARQIDALFAHLHQSGWQVSLLGIVPVVLLSHTWLTRRSRNRTLVTDNSPGTPLISPTLKSIVGQCEIKSARTPDAIPQASNGR